MAESEARAVVREMVPLVTALEALNQQLDGFRNRLGPSPAPPAAAGVGGRAGPHGACALGLAVLWRCEAARQSFAARLAHTRASSRPGTHRLRSGLVLRPFLALYAGTARLHGPVSAPPQYCDGRHRQVQCHPADSHVLPFRRPRRPRRQVRRTAGPPSHQPNEARVDAEPVGSGCASRHLPPAGCLRFRMDRNSRSTSSSFAF
jgi:hypothetical protein